MQVLNFSNASSAIISNLARFFACNDGKSFWMEGVLPAGLGVSPSSPFSSLTSIRCHIEVEYASVVGQKTNSRLQYRFTVAVFNSSISARNACEFMCACVHVCEFTSVQIEGEKKGPSMIKLKSKQYS